jgi:hypothetical protein
MLESCVTSFTPSRPQVESRVRQQPDLLMNGAQFREKETW